jgi:hypothetical protein
MRWFQRDKTNEILKGDNNTKYFQMAANEKRRKTRFFRLEQVEGTIEGEDQLQEYVTNYYKELFGKPERNNFSMDESLVEDVPQITPEENEALVAEFSEKEVPYVIFQMKHNESPGPDGFPAEFYQVFRSLIKNNLMAMFRDFHNGSLPLFCLNFGTITLLPKAQEVTKFSNIALFACSMLVFRFLQK